MGAVAWYGPLTWTLLGVSLGLTALALAAFQVGVRVQDRRDGRTFHRAVLGFLAVLGLWLLVRATRPSAGP